MRYEARPPRAELEPFVRCLWRLRGAPSELEPQPIVPDGCFELIVHLGEPFVERGVYAPEGPGRAGQAVKQPRALLAATLTRTVVVAASGDVDVVGVRFHPGRAYPFLSAAPSEVVDTVAPALDVVARELASLPARLEPASTETLFATVEDALCTRLSRVGSDPRFDRIAMAVVADDAPGVSRLAASSVSRCANLNACSNHAPESLPRCCSGWSASIGSPRDCSKDHPTSPP